MELTAFPILNVDDLAAARRFYEWLGFEVSYRFPPDGEPEFVTMTRDSATIGIGLATGGEPDHFAYWVYVDDVDATVAKLRSAGAETVAAPENQRWGERMASVRDPAGNLVHLGARS